MTKGGYSNDAPILVPEEACRRPWLGSQGMGNRSVKHDEAVSKLARAFTGESWSHAMGMFGLGDRVAMRQVRASVDGLEHIMDVGGFRRRLEEIEKRNTLDGGRKESVMVVHEAWRKRETRDDRR